MTTYKNRKRSDKSHATLDIKSRVKKAEKIEEILSQYKNISNSNVLDIGTGAGVVAAKIAKHSATVTSVDIYDERINKEGYKFIKVNDERLPFKNNAFDIVISNHVVEHVSQQKLHIEEALRVTKPGGVFYIATPNKLWISDPHYRLFLVSWLPRSLASLYVRIARGKGKKWDIYPVSHMYLKQKFRNHEYINGLPLVLKAGNKKISHNSVLGKLMSKLPGRLLDKLQIISPTLVYIVKK